MDPSVAGDVPALFAASVKGSHRKITGLIRSAKRCSDGVAHLYLFEAVTKLKIVCFEPQDIALGFGVERNL